jgi:hypothetical protein
LKAAAPPRDYPYIEACRELTARECGLALPLPFVLDKPSRVGTIGDTSYVTIQSHLVADSNDLAGFAVKTGASL